MERNSRDDVRKRLEQLATGLQGLSRLVRTAAIKAEIAKDEITTADVPLAATSQVSDDKPRRLRILVEPHAKLVWEGAKKLIVHARVYNVVGEKLYFGDKEFVYGVMSLAKPKPISLAEFRRLRSQHKITEEERKKWWPKARRLYAYRIEELEPFDKPKAWEAPQGAQTFVLEPRFKRSPKAEELAGMTRPQKAAVQRALGLAQAFAQRMPDICEQAERLMEPVGHAQRLLKALGQIGPMLTAAYSEVADMLGVAAPAPVNMGNPFILAERLLEQLHRTVGSLPEKTRALALTEDAIDYLEAFLELEESFGQEGATIGKDWAPSGLAPDALYILDAQGLKPIREDETFVEVAMAEQPKGKLPTLKLPDPAFNLRRLKADEETGVLSRLRRTGRVGQRQFLLNEVQPTKAGAQYVWGVITLNEGAEYEDMSKLPAEVLAGIDKFSREEFSTEGPVFYMKMHLVAAYDPPLQLAKPLLSRRYGPVIELPAALKKAEDPPAEDEEPWMSFRGLTPNALKGMDDGVLLALYAQAKQLLETVFAEGKTTAGGGLSREDVENGIVFIEEELKRRGIAIPNPAQLASLYKAGPSDRYAPVHPGSDGEFPELTLKELLPHFHKEFLLRSPFVYIVGSTANNGVTKNDVDMLVRGPLDPATSHIVKFRIGRMMPEEISQRMSFHGGVIGKDDDDVASGLAGPFTANVPIYDLVVRRRDDYQTIVEMREADLPVEPIAELMAKEDPFLKPPHSEKPMRSVLQAHFRGKSVHGDFRIAANGYLIGYTLAMQVAGKVPDVNTLPEAKKIGATFSVEGSSWNKPFNAPNRVYAATKAPEPKQWLGVEEAFEPGTVGATREEAGVMVILAEPRVTWGERTPYFHEYFLEKDPKFSGLLTFRLLVSEAGKPSDPEVEAGRKMPKGVPFWVAMFAKDLVPSVLKPRAVEVGRIPPQGYSYLPPKLKAVVPKEFQYWHAKDEKERKQIRDALVAEHFFTPSNVKLVDHEFRRVVTKYYLYEPTEATGHSPSNMPRPPTAIHDTGETLTCQEKAEGVSSAPFTLSWQRWKGQQVIRAAPSRMLYHLFIDRGGKVEDFQLLEDPSSGQRVSGVHRMATGAGAGELLKLDGDVEPGKSYGGLELNPTKDTPSSISVLARGSIEFLEDGPAFKKFKLKGKDLPKGLSGLLVLRAETKETGEGSIWIWEKSEGVGEPVQRAAAPMTGEAGRSHRHAHHFHVDAQGNGKTTDTVISEGSERRADDHTHEISGRKVKPARGHAHDKPEGHTHELPAGIEKAEKLETITLASGKKIADVQVWDPKTIKPGDDKTHDRERLRPFAIYKPMKTASRESNEFRSNELDRLFTDFATPEMLKSGILVEPKFNGFRSSIQKTEDGRYLMITEDIWDRKTPITNMIDQLPGLKEELDKLPGPFILDAEFTALEPGGGPVPRRELATFRGRTPAEDKGARVRVFDILYHPKKGNVVAKPLEERNALLRDFLRGHDFTRLVYVPHKLVRNKEELRSAIEWARRYIGSEGAMFKSSQSTVTLRETDSWAKLKMIREIRGIIWDAHPVKGSPGVHNFFYAVGPVSGKEAGSWAETVEVAGKTYVKAGRTFNTKVAAKVGDVIRIEVTEILWDESNAEKKRLRGFTPVVVDKADGGPSSLKDVHEMLGSGELKKSADEYSDALAKSFGACSHRVELVKQEDERYVLGVVLVPDEFDSQGDIYDAESVRKAAFYFMEETQRLGLMHQRTLARDKVRVLESYIAPTDLHLDGHFVKKGTWLLAARVLDDALWQAVKDGRLTGWSIEGFALAANLD